MNFILGLKTFRAFTIYSFMFLFGFHGFLVSGLSAFNTSETLGSTLFVNIYIFNADRSVFEVAKDCCFKSILLTF
jgi:hypothetical protein